MHGKINTVQMDIHLKIPDSYASRIKFVGTMGRDFKKKRRSRKNGTSGHPIIQVSNKVNQSNRCFAQ